MCITGVVTVSISLSDAVIGTMLLAGGMAFLLTGIVRHRRENEGSESDERSKKIGVYGLSYAWLTGILFMFVLFWLDYMHILVIGTQIALALSILVLAISAVIYQRYLFRKGDVG